MSESRFKESESKEARKFCGYGRVAPKMTLIPCPCGREDEYPAGGTYPCTADCGRVWAVYRDGAWRLAP